MGIVAAEQQLPARAEEEKMKDAFLDRMWVDHHERFSSDVWNAVDNAKARLTGAAGDPLPMVGRAMALVLAVSLASLSLGATIA